MLDQESTEKLIKAVKAGDSRARQELAGLFLHRTFRIASRYIGNRPDAEDRASEASFKAIKAIEECKFAEGTNLQSWLDRIVRNAIIDWRRSQEPPPPPRGIYERMIHDFFTAEYRGRLLQRIRETIGESVSGVLCSKIEMDAKRLSYTDFRDHNYETKQKGKEEPPLNLGETVTMIEKIIEEDLKRVVLPELKSDLRKFFGVVELSLEGGGIEKAFVGTSESPEKLALEKVFLSIIKGPPFGHHKGTTPRPTV